MSVFRYSHRVTYTDCTVGDHIYYSRYLDLLEAARGEFFRELGTGLGELQKQGAIFPVIECRIRYRAAAHYDESLMIELWPIRAEGVHLDFGFRVSNQEGALIAEGETLHACTGLDQKPKRLPEQLRARLKPLLAG